MKKLQSLTLWSCCFNKLPDEIIQLEDLRLLDVRGCKIEENPFDVMGRCTKLEELYFIENGSSQGEHVVNIFGKTELALKL